MARLRSAFVGGLLTLAALSTQASADVQVCVDDQQSCPALPGDDAATSDPQTVGPPVVVEPFSVAPTPTAAPQADQLVVVPGAGADKQHLPPGPPNFQVDP